MIIVSSCLAGLNCRYDCQSRPDKMIQDLVTSGQAIPVCPEQMGGLSTPRPPAEIQDDGKILTNQKVDVTKAFNLGALEALKVTQQVNAQKAYLKQKSPMCGAGEIYDGSFTGKVVEGDGVFTQLLKKHNIKVHPVP
jgi:uncharacterized protein YbbK (DUF523 family)